MCVFKNFIRTVNNRNRNVTMELRVNSAATIVMPCFGIQCNISHTSLMLWEIDFNSLAAFTLQPNPIFPIYHFRLTGVGEQVLHDGKFQTQTLFCSNPSRCSVTKLVISSCEGVP